MTEISSNQFMPIFCGGTSLMKGHKIIRRFSEDVDFKILNKKEITCTRGERRNFRETVINQIRTVETLNVLDASIIARDSSRFFAILIEYPKIFEVHSSLRPKIKIECTFVEEVLSGYQEKEIAPIINEFTKSDRKSTISCLSILETCADKLSALTWRILSRDRLNEQDDKAIIRHLYDLHALSKSDLNKDQLLDEVRRIFDHDRLRGNINEGFDEALAKTLNVLRTDEEYQAEYQQYVVNMCFGHGIQSTFENTVESLSKYQDKS